MKFTPVKSFIKKASSRAKNFKKSFQRKNTIIFRNDITDQLYKLNLLGKSDREKYEKKLKRDFLAEIIYEDLLILQTSTHDENKKKKKVTYK